MLTGGPGSRFLDGAIPGQPKPAPLFFPSRGAFRSWLSKNHGKESELWLGYHKKGSGRKSVTYQEALDEALCYGWIDGVLRRIDDDSYMQRWTPRKPKSNWSAVNVAKVERLEKEGRMTEAGRAAFARREESRTAVYAYEQKKAPTFTPAQRKTLAANAKAKQFFDAQPAWYRRNCTAWVASAKRAETRERRLRELIARCAMGEWLRGFPDPKPQLPPSWNE